MELPLPDDVVPELELELLDELLEELDELLELLELLDEPLEGPFEELFDPPELEPPLLEDTAGPPSSLKAFSFWSNMA